MTAPKLQSLLATLVVAILAFTARAEDSPDVKMTLLPSDAMLKLGGYRPQLLTLSSDRPANLKKSPSFSSPLYGSIQFGAASYLVALDEPEGKDAALFVDANGNGDLTDDPAATWIKSPNTDSTGRQVTTYAGSFQLPIQTGNPPTLVSLHAYRFDKNDTARASLKDKLLYYGDYAYDGEITLNGAKYHAMLTDANTTGDFRGSAGKDAAPGAGSGVRLMLDLNADGRFSPRGEIFDVTRPFNIKGTTWVLADLTPAGSFKIAKSAQTVAEILPPPDHSVGKVITPFRATRMDGTTVNFPGDYKGKLVMLDFWATWCGPCMGEVPGLVKAYNQFHPKGLDILGISLDQPNAADKVTSITSELGMTWPQVYDGKFWKAEIADLYGISSIPAAFLVDGDTGRVLAAGNSLRGESLIPTFQAALAKKAESNKPPTP